jgi:hypothetical protein
MTLVFTKDEKINFMRQWGYTINTYESQRESDFYAGELVNVKIDVVHLQEINKSELDNMDVYHLRQKFGLDEVFEKEFSTRLKKFLFKKL